MKIGIGIFLSLLTFQSVLAQKPSDFTIVFQGQAKVNVPQFERESITNLFGTVLGRTIESHEDHDLVWFDGGGFLKLAYHSDDMVIPPSQFIKSMQLGLLVPSSEYEKVMNAIKSSGAKPVLPEVEKYQDHSNFYYFHAPGGQIFRIVNSITTMPKTGEGYMYDAERAQKYGADDYGMKKYIFAFLKRGPNRDFPKDKANELQNAHMQNIIRLANEGKLILAGPFFGDGDLRGIYIFDVPTLEEAKALTETDPAIQAGSLVMELMEWYGAAALMAIPEIDRTLVKKSIID
jgi:uncharacterized protein YciI